MAKGKRELILEIDTQQFKLVEFKKLLDENLKLQGIKYSDNVKMYFNVIEKIVYVVTNDGKQLQIKF